MALTYILVCAFIIFSRITYPLEMECLEGTTMQHIYAVLNGGLLYAPPTQSFVASIYTPLYYYLAIPFYFAFGQDFFAVRLFSTCASAGSILLLFFICKHVSASKLTGFLSAGLFCAAFSIYGSWLDLARVDSLSLMFSLWGLYFFLKDKNSLNNIMAGILLSLSFFTKQSVLPLVLGLSVIACFKRDGRRRWMLPLTSLVFICAACLYLELKTHGWFGYYVFKLPSMHPLNKSMIASFWSRDVLSNFPVLALTTIAGIILVLIKRRNQPSDWVIPAAAFLLFMCSYPSRIKNGGYINLLMPTVAGLIIFFIWSTTEIIKKFPASEWMRALLFFIIAAQFTLLKYPVKPLIPTQAQWKAAETALGKMNAVNGKVFMSEHVWYLKQNMKTMQASQPAAYDIIHSKDSINAGRLRKMIANDFNSSAYDAVILDAGSELLPIVKDSEKYMIADSVIFPPNTFTLSGSGRLPAYLFTRIESR